jgi:capsid protein
MTARLHPLSGLPINGKPVNGKPRAELTEALNEQRQAKLSIDAARSGTDLDGHWRFADSLDPDNAYSQAVRHTLIKRSRYEQTSNSYYIGAIRSYVSSLVGAGPKLRMLTRNRDFNQLVEREFGKWQEQVSFRRKLKAMAHALTGDGEGFALIQNNAALPTVQLDFMPFEAEQCQSDWIGVEDGRVDGIYFDSNNNIVAYDILPNHPGSGLGTTNRAVKVAASGVLHWFNLERPGAHRGIPAMTSGLSTGALARRHREATVKAAETAASIGAILTTNSGGETEPDEMRPFTTAEFVHRMLMVAPMGWDAKQMKGEHPNAQYQDFHRLNISEMVRGISMPFNAAACDSSTYSFASGKLDTLLFRNQIDGDRHDCDELICNPLFALWFREWRLLVNSDLISDEIAIPTHQWDWPVHAVIDEVANANATDTRLKNGTLTLRQAFSDVNKDLEDELIVFAEDTFGEANDETILKARQMLRLINTPQHAIQYVAQLMGVSAPAPQQPQGAPANEPAPQEA